jgi:hypothetical protein
MKNTEGYFGTHSQVYNMKSDQFFEQDELEKTDIALAFIDGDHVYEVVNRDFWSTVEYMAPGGFIFLHDTLPPNKNWMAENKCGSVNLLRHDLEGLAALDVFTFPFSAFHVGLTMVRRREDRDWELNNGS